MKLTFLSCLEGGNYYKKVKKRIILELSRNLTYRLLIQETFVVLTRFCR
jgi:hypothetical protein